MAFLLPAIRYPDIRRILDPTLGDAAIPVELIESDLYLGEAERWVVRVDSLAATRTGEEQKAVFRAIIYYTAALISPGLPQTKQENMAGHSATMAFAETAQERTARLLGLASAAIAPFIPAPIPVLTGAVVFVTTVAGRRA